MEQSQIDSKYELQKIDCNCNDCAFMTRNQEKFKESLNNHEKWQKNFFESMKRKRIEKAEEWEKKKEFEKAEVIRKEVSLMRFQFNKSECKINFGTCTKFNKEVTFIPNLCQLDTVECFIHRKDFKL